MNKQSCERASEVISEYIFTSNEYTPSVNEALEALNLIDRLIAEHFDYLSGLHKKVKIKQGDYVNGCRVEMVEVINKEPHYLIAYFDWGAKKPQSRWLPEHLVTSVVSAEDFERVRSAIHE